MTGGGGGGGTREEGEDKGREKLIGLPEFLLIEMLRSGKIQKEDVQSLRSLFESFDDDANGVLDKEELLRHNFAEKGVFDGEVERTW